MNSVSQLLPLFFLLFIGSFLGKTGLTTPQFRKDLTDFCFLVLFPASVVDSFHMTVLDTEIMVNSAKLIVFGIIWLAIPFATALWLTKLFRVECAVANVLVFAAVYNNFGFAGLGIVSSLYGAEGLLYANMLGLAYRVTNMPIGVWIMERRNGNKSGTCLLSVIKSPPVAALLIMLLVAILGIPLPDVIYKTASMLQDCLAPIGMMVTGMAIADFSIGELVKGKLCYFISAVRLVLVPAMMAVLMWAMGMQGVAYAAPLLIMGMPVAANCSLMAQKYGADTKLAAQCVLVSTVLSLVTIPFLAVIGNRML